MSVLVAIAVLALLIVVHELGHFMAARLQGIYANRFSIGFGPIVWKYQGKETEYALRAFPLGGFVGFPDDDPESTIPPEDPNLLKNRPLLDRAIVISAGVIANLVFAYLVLLVMVGSVGIQQAAQPGIVIDGFLQVSEVRPPAAAAGVQSGDTLFIDGEKDAKRLSLSYNAEQDTATLLTANAAEPTSLAIGRKETNGKLQPKPIVIPAQTTKGQGDTGIQLQPTPAIRAGMRPGDVVIAANGTQLGRSIRDIQTFQTIIREHPGQPVQIEVKRDTQTLPLVVTPQANEDDEGSIGVGLSPNGGVERQKVSGLAAFGAAATEFQNIVNDTVVGFGRLISRFSKVANQVAGPVAIVAVGAKIAQSDAAALFQFTALISINLAIINILPLPALDGGHLAFLLIEGIRGKPLPNNVQDGVMQTGLMLLLGLGIFLIIRDTANLIPQ